MLKHHTRSYIRWVLASIAVVGLLWGFSLHLLKEPAYHTVLPVGFKLNGTPYVDVEIEGTSYQIQVDLGSRLEMELYPDALKRLNKTPHGTEKFKNFRGKEFVCPKYQIKKINLGSLTFNQPTVVESPQTNENTLWDNSTKDMKPDPDIGSLGRGLLKKVNLLLDMKQLKIIATNDLEKLQKDGYNLETFVKIPFTLDQKGIFLEAETDLGRLKLILDTGCSITALQELLYPKDLPQEIKHGLPTYNSNRFILDGVNFGALEFYFVTMGQELCVIDGILGMNFIKNHVMYIDFSNHIVYICKSS